MNRFKNLFDGKYGIMKPMGISLVQSLAARVKGFIDNLREYPWIAEEDFDPILQIKVDEMTSGRREGTVNCYGSRKGRIVFYGDDGMEESYSIGLDAEHRPVSTFEGYFPSSERRG